MTAKHFIRHGSEEKSAKWDYVQSDHEKFSQKLWLQFFNQPTSSSRLYGIGIAEAVGVHSHSLRNGAEPATIGTGRIRAENACHQARCLCRGRSIDAVGTRCPLCQHIAVSTLASGVAGRPPSLVTAPPSRHEHSACPAVLGALAVLHAPGVELAVPVKALADQSHR